MPYTVFISHAVSPKDYPLVVSISNLLWQNGMQAFVAEWMPQYGESIDKKVADQIDASDAVLAIITPDYTRASFANQEIGYAKAKQKMIIPLVEKGTRVTGFMYGLDKLEFDRTNFVEAAKNLAGFLKKKKIEKDDNERLANLVLLGLGLWVLSEMGKSSPAKRQ